MNWNLRQILFKIRKIELFKLNIGARMKFTMYRRVGNSDQHMIIPKAIITQL